MLGRLDEWNWGPPPRFPLEVGGMVCRRVTATAQTATEHSENLDMLFAREGQAIEGRNAVWCQSSIPTLRMMFPDALDLSEM